MEMTPPSEREWTEEDRQWFERVRSLEAKIAELEAKFAEAERLRLYNLDQVTDLLKQNALWQADNRDKAAIIERLEAALRFVQGCAVQCPACKQYVDAALNEQEKP